MRGALLAQKAQALWEAGLRRITVSLDSLDDHVFKAMNDAGFPVAQVLEGIEAAAWAGLRPVKVNMVVKRGVNSHCILDIARHFRGTRHILRFIEYMDVGTTNGWRLEDVVSAADMIYPSHRRGVAAGSGGTELPRRGGQTLPLPGRTRRDRGYRIGYPAFLPHLHQSLAVG